MKVKVKFDQKAIRDYLLHSVEKIVFGLVAVVFLWMLYSALSKASGFGKSPAELQADVRRGEGVIKNTSPEIDLPVRDYADLAKRSHNPIDEAPYQFAAEWDSPLFPGRSLRVAPLLLAVQELRGAAGVGAFRAGSAGGVEAANPRGGRGANRPQPARGGGGRGGRDDDGRGGGRGGDIMAPTMARAAAGEQLNGKRWVVVTGLVPIERQEAAYADAFRTAVGYDPQRDYRPNYVGYLVQRLEVAGPSEAANPDWSKATELNSRTTIAKAVEEWPQVSEVIGPEYVEENLVFPLGPLVNRAWDASVAHEPEIPMPKADAQMFDRGGGRGGAAMEERGGFVAVGRGGRRDAAGADVNVADTPFGRIEVPAADGERAAAVDAQPADEPKPHRYRLFRFFDFDVEPGKQYVYRVCLGVINPNHGQKASNLKSPDLAKETYLKTKWSEPSSVIPVPRDTRLYAVSVTPPRGSNPPSGQIMAVSWVHDKGLELHKDFLVVRGQVANFLKETVQRSAVDFVSDATIVDMRGGEKLPGSRNPQSASGQFLILDPDGNLHVRDELDDAADREKVVSAQASEEGRGDAAPGRGGRGGLEEIDGGRGGRGGRD